MLTSLRLPCLIVGLSAFFLGRAELLAQQGPTVQLFTSNNPSGDKILPMARPLMVTVNLDTGYDTNATTTGVSQSSSFFATASTHFSYAFGTDRTHANLSTSAAVSYYDNGNSGGGFRYDPNIGLQLAVAHDVSERLSLNLSVYGRYGVEPDFASGLTENRRSGNFLLSASSVSASYQWLERLSTSTSYSLSIVRYDDNNTGQFLNRVEQGFTQGINFLFLPTTTLSANYSLSISQFETAGMDTMSQYFVAGLSQTFGPHLQGSFRAGGELRSSDQQAQATFSPYGEATFNLTLGERTSLSFYGRYAKTDSNTIEASSATSLSTGLTMSFGLTPRITGSLSAYYTYSENIGRTFFFFQFPSFVEQSIDVGVDLQYAVSPRLSITAGCHVTDVSSDAVGRDYSRIRFSGGMSYAF